jgi:hypothetical protein
MARDENRAIEIVVRADIVSSVQQIEHDIGKIQEKLNRALNVTASIKKIQIDKTAVNYIKNEIKKMFNTVTVDIDGNILGVGKGTATAVKQQTDAIQKAVSAAQKKLSNIKIDYGGGMSSQQKAEFDTFQKQLDALKASVDTTAPEIAELASNMDVFAHSLAKQKKDLAANAAEMKKVAAAYREADKIIDSINANYLDKMDGAQAERYNSLIDQLYAARGNSSTGLGEAEQIRNQLDELQRAAKTVSTIQKKEAAEKASADAAAKKAAVDRVKAVNSLIAAEKKLIALSSQITNTYGDMPGSYMQDDEDVKAFISALDVYIQKSTVASERTKVLADALRTTWITYGKLDATQMHDFTQSLHMDAIADGSTGKISDMASVLETLAVRLNRAKIVSSEFQHELADESAAQRFRNSVNQNIRKLEEFYEKHTKLRSNTAFSAEYSSIMEELNTALSSGDKSGAKMAADHLADYIHRAKEAGLTTETLGEKIQKAYQKFGGWAIVSGTFMKVTQAIRDMINNVIRLDSCLTELKKVTDETSDSYDAFMQRTKNTAKEIGSTVTDLVSATADWGRLGYSLSDAEELAKISTIYANVGDDIEGIDDATANLISTIQGFKELDASDALNVVDILNRVSNEFPASAGGLGESLRRSSAALSAAGNTLQESISLITAADAVLQDPASTGTMMKTISMYLRAAKTEAEEAGESVDGMANSVSELRSELMALTGNRVDIMLNED